MNLRTTITIVAQFVILAGVAGSTGACASESPESATSADELTVSTPVDTSQMQDVLLELDDGTYALSCDLAESPSSFHEHSRIFEPTLWGAHAKGAVDARYVQEHAFASASLKYVFTIAGGALLSADDPRAKIERFNSLAFGGEAYRYDTHQVANDPLGTDVLTTPLSTEEVTFRVNGARVPAAYRERPRPTYEGTGISISIEEKEMLPAGSGRMFEAYNHFYAKRLVPGSELQNGRAPADLRFNTVAATLTTGVPAGIPLIVMNLKELTASVALPARAPAFRCVETSSYGGGPQTVCGSSFVSYKFRTAKLGCALAKTR